MVLNPKVKYFFGKVTMYTNYEEAARNAIIYFLHRYFPDPDKLMTAVNPMKFNIRQAYYKSIFTASTYAENYKILLNEIRSYNETIPPLIGAYMSLSPTMRTFDTFLNTDFGAVEETGILITIPDIYPERRERYTRWEGWKDHLQQRRFRWRQRLLAMKNSVE